MVEDIKNAILAVGVGIVVLVIISYLSYMIGLIFVLRRMHRLSWMSFVPLLNYFSQVRAVGAPDRWFLLSLPPYIGAVYAAAVSIRLGRVFGRGPAFSLTWLTFGAPIGMWMVAFGKQPPDPKVLAEPPVLVDLKKLKKDKQAAKDKPASAS